MRTLTPAQTLAQAQARSASPAIASVARLLATLEPVSPRPGGHEGALTRGGAAAARPATAPRPA